MRRAALVAASLAAAGLGLCRPGPAAAMSFSFVPFASGGCAAECPTVIVAEGDIQLGDAETFVEKVKARITRDRNLRAVVLINSNGGNVAASMGLAYAFRAMKATVVVATARPNGAGAYAAQPGVCGSACVFSLLGGVKRVVPESSKLGVHWVSGPTPQAYFGNVVQPDPTQKTDPDKSEAIIRQFLRAMGVRQDFAAFIRKVPHESFHILKPEEITRFGLASRTFR